MAFCPHCHDLDLRDPAIRLDLPDERAEAGLYISWGEDDADFNILGEEIQPNNPRLLDCHFCALVSDLLAQLDPVLGVLRKWKNADVSVTIEKRQNLQLCVDTQNLVPGKRYYELYAPPDVDYPLHSQGRASEDLPPFPGSERLWQSLNGWLKECEDEHLDCRVQRADWNPTRLIKVDGNTQRLIETPAAKSARTVPHKYVALSHCWGTEQPLRTLKDNLESHLHDVPSFLLPRVFQDSLTVVRKLGLSYIWIDSLCIVQDDRDDWARESVLMGDVYEQACLTISATACQNGTVPFLGPDVPWADLRTFTQTRREQLPQALRALKLRRMPDGVAYQGPIMSRAWTLQERFFSNRTIHFTDYQTQWKCKQVHGCETDPQRLVQPNYSRVKVRRDELNRWNGLVHEYSGLSLTKLSDKLPAISGLAGHFQPQLDSPYLAGLWGVRLTEQLAWSLTIPEPDVQELPHQNVCTLPQNWPPSWSWASITGRIWTYVGSLHVESLSKAWTGILSTQCVPATANKFGEVETGARICLDCQIRPVTIEYRPEQPLVSHKYALTCSGGDETVLVSPDCLLTSTALKSDSGLPWAGRASQRSEFDPSERWSAMAVVMPLLAERETPPCCLLLGKQIGYEKDTYQRIGYLGALADEVWSEIRKGLCATKIVLV